MAARRLLILLLMLLVVSTLASTLIPQRAQREQSGTETDRTRGRDDTGGERSADGPPIGKHLSRTVDAAPRAVKRIDIDLGDQLSLTVRSGTADQVEIPALGMLEDVHPDAPARFDLLPPAPGTFEVRVVGSHRAIARIRVRRRSPTPQTRSPSHRRRAPPAKNRRA